MHRLCVVAIALSLSLAAAADGPAERALAMAGAMGDTWYVWKMRDAPVGYARYRVAAEDGKTTLAVRVDVALRHRGKRIELSFAGSCRSDAHLTPVDARGRMTSEEGALRYTIADGVALATVAGRPGSNRLPLPAGTVMWTLLPLVAASMPFTDGASLPFGQLEVEDWAVKPDRTLRRVGLEQISRAGATIDAQRFDASGVAIWVGAGRRVLRARWDGRKSLELADEKAAKAALGD